MASSQAVVWPDPTALCCPTCCASLYYLVPGNDEHECGARCAHCSTTWWLPNGAVRADAIPQRADPQQLNILGVPV